MKSVSTVNPFECRMWDMHDRFDTELTVENCQSEIASFSKHGQQKPVLARRLANDPKFKIELIFGSRRLFVAQLLNVPLLVELRDNISDLEGIFAMEIEHQFVEPSDYERGCGYLRYLRAGHFKNQEDLARKLDVSQSKVSRRIRLAQLPAVIVSAFSRPSDLIEAWGLEIAKALEDPKRRESICRVARTIAVGGSKLRGEDVFRRLLQAPRPGRAPKCVSKVEVVNDNDGQPLYRIRQETGAVAIVLPIAKLPPDVLGALRIAIAGILTKTKIDTHESTQSSSNGSLFPARNTVVELPGHA